jgi:hypothetical protein
MLLLRLLLSAMGAQATVIELARHSSIHKLEAMGGSSGARSNSSLLLAARFFVKLVEIFLLIQSINSSMAKLHATTPIPTHESINGDLKLVRISSGISLARARARTGGSACQHGLHLHGAVHSSRKRGTVPRSLTRVRRPQSRVGDEAGYGAIRSRDRVPELS